jgi:hypothetical protein
VQLQSLQVRDPNDFEQAFQSATRQASSLVVIQDIVMVTHLKRIVDLAAKYRLPEIYMEADFAEAGGMISYGPSQPDITAEGIRAMQDSFPGLQRMMDQLDAADRELDWTEIKQQLSQFEGTSGFEAPGEVLIGVGTK